MGGQTARPQPPPANTRSRPAASCSDGPRGARSAPPRVPYWGLWLGTRHLCASVPHPQTGCKGEAAPRAEAGRHREGQHKCPQATRPLPQAGTPCCRRFRPHFTAGKPEAGSRPTSAHRGLPQLPGASSQPASPGHSRPFFQWPRLKLKHQHTLLKKTKHRGERASLPRLAQKAKAERHPADPGNGRLLPGTLQAPLPARAHALRQGDQPR